MGLDLSAESDSKDGTAAVSSLTEVAATPASSSVLAESPDADAPLSVEAAALPESGPGPGAGEAAIANKLLGRLAGQSASVQARQQLGAVTGAAASLLGRVGKRLDSKAAVDVGAILGDEKAKLLLKNTTAGSLLTDEQERRACAKHTPAASFSTAKRDASHVPDLAYVGAGSQLTDVQEMKACARHQPAASFSAIPRDTGMHFVVGAVRPA